MRLAKCDNCGYADDWSQGQVPFFNGGVLCQFRSDSGSDEFDHELELCSDCREKLLQAMPKLKKAIKEGKL